MGLFAAQLASRVFDRPVTDHTGLAGDFDIELQWVPEQSADLGPSIFTALQEQLGLKLEAQKGIATVLSIDHVDKPSKD